MGGVTEFFVATRAIADSLIAQGWTPPPEPKQQAEFATGKILEALNAPFRGDADLTRRLRAAGWPPEPPKPKVRRLRVLLWQSGSITKSPIEDVSELAEITNKVIGSAIVELTESVFDEEWKR